MKDKQNETKRRSPLLTALSASHIELSGNRELLIEGSKGVLEYSPENVRVNTADMMITVCGRGLNLRCISESALMIDGCITSLQFGA